VPECQLQAVEPADLQQRRAALQKVFAVLQAVA
jgi:hypothetical protein